MQYILNHNTTDDIVSAASTVLQYSLYSVIMASFREKYLLGKTI